MRIIGNDGKEYKTVKECREADEALAEQQRKAKEQQEALRQQRAERAEEVKQAYEAVLAANKHYNELVKKFTKDYGSYHVTLKQQDLVDSVFEALFGHWF